MSELMRCLYDYRSARRVLDFLPQPREAALLETLTEQQKASWDSPLTRPTFPGPSAADRRISPGTCCPGPWSA